MTTQLYFVIEAGTPRWFEEFYRDIELAPKYIFGLLEDQKNVLERELTQEAQKRLGVNSYPVAWYQRQKKFVWSNDEAANERGRRWWYAHKQPGPYRRTGKTGRAWNVRLDYKNTVDGMEGTININNPTRGASYVYGYEPTSWQRVPSHEVTGWQNAGGSPEINSLISRSFQVHLEYVDKIARAFDL